MGYLKARADCWHTGTGAFPHAFVAGLSRNHLHGDLRSAAWGAAAKSCICDDSTTHPEAVVRLRQPPAVARQGALRQRCNRSSASQRNIGNAESNRSALSGETSLSRKGFDAVRDRVSDVLLGDRASNVAFPLGSRAGERLPP